jgi:hypothetical protein
LTFEVDFLNDGGIQAQGFRLDIDGADIADHELADYIVPICGCSCRRGADPQQTDHPRAPQTRRG